MVWPDSQEVERKVMIGWLAMSWFGEDIRIDLYKGTQKVRVLSPVVIHSSTPSIENIFSNCVYKINFSVDFVGPCH